MKKLIIILSITLAICSGYAQTKKIIIHKDSWLNSTINLKNGEVLEGFTWYKTYEKFALHSSKQYLYYKSSEKSKQKKYYADQVESFTVKFDDGVTETYTYIPIEKKKYKIFRVIKQGDISLFGRNVTIINTAPMATGSGFIMQFNGISIPNEFYIMKKGDDIAFPLAKAKREMRYFKKQMQSYFVNCPELEKKLEDKLIYEKLEEIILFALSHC